MPGRHCANLEDALPIFSGDPLLFRPGTEYRYSTYDWILVSAVVEAAAKKPFVAFMNPNVLRPLEMRDTVPDESDDVRGTTSFYFPRAAQRPHLGIQDAPPADYSCFAASGVFLSTPSDLVRFASAMMRPGFLKAETVALLQTPVKLESGASTSCALGWNVESVQLEGGPARMVGHRGSSMGGTASLMTFPDRALSIAITSNISYAKGIEPFGLKVAEAFRRLRARAF
jgi:serine beta-lactamase-like protein LACTB, mitochondrial